jgi:hypothetical protein
MERAFEVVTAGGSSDDRKPDITPGHQGCLVLTQEGQAHGKPPFHAGGSPTLLAAARTPTTGVNKVVSDATAARHRFNAAPLIQVNLLENVVLT